MSESLVKQEFLTELESILESDEAYGSNVQVLTYSVKKDVINGKFKDSWNKRVYEFVIDIDGINYKPAAKLDSFSVDELPVRFDAYSEGYGSLFEDTRLDGKLTGKRTKKPKCGNEGYGCGFSCIGLAKTCRILSSGQKTKGNFQERAIGKERLSKLLNLGDKILALGKKGALIRASDIKDQITRERSRKAGQLVEERKEKLAQRQSPIKEAQPAKNASKLQKEQPAELKSDPTTNPKTHSIKTQKEFEDVFYHVLDKLGGNDVRIAKVREAIGELVPRNKFNQYLKELQGNDDVTLYAGSSQNIDDKKEVENAITTRVNGLRMLIKLETQGKDKLKNLSTEKKKEIEEQLKGRPDLDPLGSARQYTKGDKITSQKDFEETTEKVRQALSDEFNYGDLVPIAKVREVLKSRVSLENFDKMMIGLQSSDKYQLIGYSGTPNKKAPKELEEGAVISKVNGARHYIKKLN